MTQDLFSQPTVQYIVQQASECHGDAARLPPLDKLAEQLGISRGKLREDLLTAQAYGLVEMRPGDGTYVRRFDFYSAIRPLVLYSVAQDKRTFDQYYRVRACLEVAFWDQAVAALDAEDHEELEGILQDAERKLRGTPIEIPHYEHRKLHTLLFSKLANPFVRGIVRAYWDAYEAAGLHRGDTTGHTLADQRSQRIGGGRVIGALLDEGYNRLDLVISRDNHKT